MPRRGPEAVSSLQDKDSYKQAMEKVKQADEKVKSLQQGGSPTTAPGRRGGRRGGRRIDR